MAEMIRIGVLPVHLRPAQEVWTSDVHDPNMVVKVHPNGEVFIGPDTNRELAIAFVRSHYGEFIEFEVTR